MPVIIFCGVEKPVVRSSYFQQMMQEAANSRHAVTPAQNSLSTEDDVDSTTTCDQHSNVHDAGAAKSTEHPVDSTKSTQQLIGQIIIIIIIIISITKQTLKVQINRKRTSQMRRTDVATER